MSKAKITLTCTECGTEYVLSKTCRNRSEADNWESYMRGKDGLCTGCWREEQQAQKKAKSDELINDTNKALAEVGIVLPELIGSVKQIAWANSIRFGVISKLTKMGLKWDVIRDKTYAESLKIEVDKLFETSAKAWIDARGKKLFDTYIE